MTKLYDHQTGQWTTVDESVIEEGLGSGRYSFPVGETVPMYDRDGNEVRVPSESAYDAIKMGHTYRSFERRHQRAQEEIRKATQDRLDKEYGVLAPMSAASLGALSTATGSLSDWGLRGLTELADNPEQELENIRSLQDAYPKSYVAGEILGAFAPSPLRIPGLGKVASGLAARLPTKFGLQKASEFAVKKGVEGAVEGAVFESGRISKDVALADPDITMESAISRVGLGAALGGGFNIGAGILGKATKGTYDAMKKMGSKVYNTTDEAIADVGTKFFTAGKGASKDQKQAINRMLKDPEFRQKAIKTVEAPEIVAAETAGVIRSTKASSDELSLKFNSVKDDLRKSGPIAKLEIEPRHVKAWENAKSEIKSTFKKIDSEKSLYGSAPRNIADEIIKITDEKISAANSVADIVDALDYSKRYVDKIGKKVGQAGYLDLSSEAGKMLHSYRDTINKQLRNTDNFGDYAQTYSKVNDTVADYLKQKDVIFGNNKKSGLFTQKVFENGQKVNVVSDDKIQRLLNSPVRKNKEAWAELNNFFEQTKRLAKVADEPVANLGKETSDAVRDLARNLKGEVETVQKQVKEILDYRQAAILTGSLESKTGRVLGQGQVGAVIGGALGGSVGAAIGGGIGSVAGRPFTSIKTLNMLQTKGKGTLDFIEKSIKKFSAGAPAAKKISKGVKPFKQVGISQLNKMLQSDDKTEKDKTKLAIKRLNEFSQNPQAVEEVLTRRALPKDEMGLLEKPQSVIDNTAARAIDFLAAKAPKLQSNEYFGGDSVSISKSQMLTFERYTQAVMNPSIMIEQLGDAKLDPITVEAVKAVYPNMYAQIQTMLMETAFDNPKLTYQQKNQLGILFDAQITTGLKNVGIMQQIADEFSQIEIAQSAQSTAPLSFSGEQTTGQRLAGRA